MNSWHRILERYKVLADTDTLLRSWIMAEDLKLMPDDKDEFFFDESNRLQSFKNWPNDPDWECTPKKVFIWFQIVVLSKNLSRLLHDSRFLVFWWWQKRKFDVQKKWIGTWYFTVKCHKGSFFKEHFTSLFPVKSPA